MVRVDDDELFLFDPEIVEQEARAVAARIIADDDAATEYRRILSTTSSRAYAGMVAERAVGIVVAYVMSGDDVPVSIVPVYGRRISNFLHQARLQLGLFRFKEDQSNRE